MATVKGLSLRVSPPLPAWPPRHVLRLAPCLTAPHSRRSQPVLGVPKVLRRTLSEPSLHTWESRANVGYDTEKLGALLDDVDRALFDSIKVDLASKGAVAAIKESIEAPTLDNIGEEKSLSPRRRPTLKCPFSSFSSLIYQRLFLILLLFTYISLQ